MIHLPSQYFALVKKMNILGCNDDFYAFFLNLWVFVTVSTMSYLNNAVVGKMGLNYYICTGEDPDYYKDIPPKVSIIHIPISPHGFIFSYCHVYIKGGASISKCRKVVVSALYN